MKQQTRGQGPSLWAALRFWLRRHQLAVWAVAVAAILTPCLMLASARPARATNYYYKDITDATTSWWSSTYGTWTYDQVTVGTLENSPAGLVISMSIYDPNAIDTQMGADHTADSGAVDMGGAFTIQTWQSLTSISNGCMVRNDLDSSVCSGLGLNYIGKYEPGLADTGDVASVGAKCAHMDWADRDKSPGGECTLTVHGIIYEGDPPPTATPIIIPAATSFPQVPYGGLCVTPTAAMTRTAMPTPTNYLLTPGATQTKPATTATATSAPAMRMTDIQFSESLSPWTVYDPVNEYGLMGFTRWEDDAGSDGEPGVAVLVPEPGSGLPEDGSSYGVSDQDGSDFEYDWQNVLVLTSSQMPFPIRISAEAKWVNLLQHEKGWIRAYYLDAGSNVAQPKWVTYKGWEQEISNSWSTIDFNMQPYTGEGLSGKVIAIALRAGSTTDELDYNTQTYYTHRAPDYAGGEQAMLDNVRISAGPGADSDLPVCLPGQGDGSSGGSTVVPMKSCFVTQNTVDVYDVCTVPSSWTDIGGWIGWLFCRVNAYFTWNSYNNAQLAELKTRSNLVEPFGTMLELPGVFNAIGATVGDLLAINAGNFLTNRTINFYSLLDWHAIDDAPSLSAGLSGEYTSNCDARVSNISANAQRSACFIVEVVKRNLTLVNLLQWAIDLGALYAFVQYARSTWFAKA